MAEPNPQTHTSTLTLDVPANHFPHSMVRLMAHMAVQSRQGGNKEKSTGLGIEHWTHS